MYNYLNNNKVMKTCKCILILVSLFISINIMATNENFNLKILSNVEETETGHTKTLTTYDEKISKPVEKTEYQYNAEGNLLRKTVYHWNDRNEWKCSQKRDYQYDDQNRPTTTVLTRWDDNKADWSSKQEKTNYSYNAVGEVSISHSKK